MTGEKPRRRVGVRVRLAGAATAALTLVLVVASLGLLVVLRDSVRNAAETTAMARAHDAVHALEAEGRLSDDIALDPGADGESAVRFMDGATVVSGSPGFAEVPEPFVTVSTAVEEVGGIDRVEVRQSWEEGQETVVDAAQALALGVPALVVVVAVASYLLTGRALRPVDEMRRRTEQISAQDLTTRVDDPGTGDEVTKLATTLNAMLDRLEASHDAQDRFVADASHELRGPIAAVRAEIAVSRRDEANDWDRTAGVVDGEAARMQALVDDLLLLARAGGGTLAERREDVDIDEVVEDVGYRLRDRGEHTVTLRTVPARVRGDRAALRRAVQNLADNGARHAASQVVLEVGPGDDGASVLVAVDDDGPGVAAEDRERVFERFVRLDAARARGTGGAGLGLAIVRQIAQAHGGSVTVTGSPLGGARFVLRLPAV